MNYDLKLIFNILNRIKNCNIRNEYNGKINKWIKSEQANEITFRNNDSHLIPKKYQFRTKIAFEKKKHLKKIQKAEHTLKLT